MTATTGIYAGCVLKEYIGAVIASGLDTLLGMAGICVKCKDEWIEKMSINATRFSRPLLNSIDDKYNNYKVGYAIRKHIEDFWFCHSLVVIFPFVHSILVSNGVIKLDDDEMHIWSNLIFVCLWYLAFYGGLYIQQKWAIYVQQAGLIVDNIYEWVNVHLFSRCRNLSFSQVSNSIVHRHRNNDSIEIIFDSRE